MASELLLPTLIMFRDLTTVPNITFQYFQCSLLHSHIALSPFISSVTLIDVWSETTSGLGKSVDGLF